jgi:hypothetical protein
MQYERGMYIVKENSAFSVSHFIISVRYKIVLHKADRRGIMIFVVLSIYFFFTAVCEEFGSFPF